MAWLPKQRVSPNTEQEIDSVNSKKKRSTFYMRNLWFADGESFVAYKRNDLTGNDTRVDLPSGHWIESKRTQARYLIGNGTDTRFNMDVKMETVGGGNTSYALVSEGQTITNPDEDTINLEWSYSHKEGPTTYPSVFKTVLTNGDFSFQFTAPTADTYKLFLQITPVIGGIVSSKLNINKLDQVYGASWELDTGIVLTFNFKSMAGQINETDTELLGNTLFLYSDNFTLLAEEGFTLG